MTPDPLTQVKAPRSKGCRVCVQRRVKCDQARPSCLRCRRANRQCPGYETTRFVDEGPSLRAMFETSESSNTTSARLPSSPSSSSSDGSAPDMGFRDIPIRSSRSSPKNASASPVRGAGARFSPITSENWYSSTFEQATLISFMCPTAYQNQLLSQFIESVRQPVLAPTFRCHSVWLREVAARVNPSSALVWAVRAISISHLGRKCQDTQLIETSRRIYGTAILKLNKVLSDPTESYSSDTLSATILLSFYEMFNCTEQHSWIRHAGGAGRLIRARGPERHREGFDQIVFMACRHILVMEAFQMQTPCFLEAPEWQELCWEIHRSIQRTTFLTDASEEFFHQLVVCPRYRNEVVEAICSPDTPPQYLQMIMEKGRQHRTDFQAIHKRLAEELIAAGQEPTKTASSFNDEVYPVVYDFPDIHIASLYCGYWCMLIVINITIIGLQAKLSYRYDSAAEPTYGDVAEVVILPDGSTQLIPKPGRRPLWDAARTLGDQHLYYQENRAYAREICKAAEYMQQTPLIGPFFLVTSLRMSLRVNLEDREKQWIVGKLTEIGKHMELARTEVEVFMSQKDPQFVNWQGHIWETADSPSGSGKSIVRTDAAV